MKKLLLASAFSLVAACAAAPVMAQAQCGDYSDVSERLETHYGETVQVAGITSDNRLMEIYASESGSWTAVLVTPSDSRSCLVAAGQGFQAVNTPFPAPTPEGDEM